MKTVDMINKLINELPSQELEWVIEAKKLLSSICSDSYKTLNVTGRSSIRDAIAILKIRKDSTKAGGIKTWGMNETIQSLSNFDVNIQVITFGYESLQKFGTFFVYFTNEKIELVGCIILVDRHKKGYINADGMPCDIV